TKAMGLKEETLLTDLIAKLLTGGKAAAPGTAKRAAGSLDALPKAGRESPLFGAILAVQTKADGPTALGLVTATREANARLSLRYPSWRLSVAVKAPTTGRVPAALIIGAPAACALGAALDGWRGRSGWDHAAALSGGLALSRNKDGVLTPEAAPVVING